MRLYLIRHPRPEIAAGICYGATDLPVASGMVDAALASLSGQLPRHLPLYSSVLQRARLLAEPLAQALGCGPVRPDARLVEMDFGHWEMQPWDQIARSEIDAWAADLVDYRPGDGETVRQVAQRVLAFQADLRATGCQQAIVVCHAGTIRLLRAWQPLATLQETARRAVVTPHQIACSDMVILDC